MHASQSSIPVDAVIIGGSFAGLSAALYLGRARRSVVVVDDGAPRNRFAAAAHGLLGHDGARPTAILAKARSQVLAYPTVSFVAGSALGAATGPAGFRVTLASGDALETSRLILAFGISDELPSIQGLADRWGRSVIHCPYCHGYEYSEKKLGVLYSTPASLHQAALVSEWGPTTLFLNGADVAESAAVNAVRAREITVEPAPVRALHGDGVQLACVELDDGRTVDVDALYVGPRTRLNSEIAQQLGCAVDEGTFGDVVRTDETKETTVSGVYAAGDISRSAHNVTWASADGVMAATAVHRSLVFTEPAPARSGR